MSHGISEMERLFSNMCVQVSFFFFFSATDQSFP